MADGPRFLIDLSAWAHSGHPAVRASWEELVGADRLLCHPVFAVELLHNAINPRDYQELRSDLEQAFDWIWPDRETAEITLRLQQRLATAATAGQRVKTPDLLIAALAVQHRIGVIHYDADYDVILARGGERLHSEWLAPRGSLETGQKRRDSARKLYRRSFGERMRQLDDDTDLEVWPQLIAWLDESLRERGHEPPPPPDIA
jgi:predicted nucleic acid-binding protein